MARCLGTLTAAGALLGLLAGCGGACSQDAPGNDQVTTGSQQASFKIMTTSVPDGAPGVSYPDTALQAEGGSGPVTWRLAGGGLPPGLSLAADGTVRGTPARAGYYEFTAEATDGSSVDQQALAIPVATFGLSVSEGLHFGDAWSGKPVLLRAAGQDGSCVFQATANGSGGSFGPVDGQAGTAVWIPGPVDVRGAEDVIRARDSKTGAECEVRLSVAADPTAGYVARFGTSDVWVLDWNVKTGSHPYATDFQAALASLGLRDPASTGARGTEADRLAELLAKVEVLRALNPLFLREPDGRAGPDGLPISFPLEQPGSGYVTPVAGGVIAGRSNGYSVMGLCDQSGRLAAVGVAFLDGAGNPDHEHDVTVPSVEMGVFINYVAQSVERSWRLYGDALRMAPVGPDDVPAMKALLLGRPDSGGRTQLIAYVTKALGDAVSAVAAHEIGHSVGLRHTATYIPGAIMNPSAALGPGIPHHFTDASLTLLREDLPGAGRATGAALEAANSPVDSVAPGEVGMCRTPLAR
jgi:hypothetical protein